MENQTTLSRKIERLMEYEKWREEIPYINFPSDWSVQIVPPIHGAIAWFKVRKDNAKVSIYLDCYENLGCWDGPYWEVYPHECDVFRCDMNDIESLLQAISESIYEQTH